MCKPWEPSAPVELNYPAVTGANRARPELARAVARVGRGDILVVARIDRLARSLPDARDIADELTTKGVALSLGVVGHEVLGTRPGLR